MYTLLPYTSSSYVSLLQCLPLLCPVSFVLLFPCPPPPTYISLLLRPFPAIMSYILLGCLIHAPSSCIPLFLYPVIQYPLPLSLQRGGESLSLHLLQPPCPSHLLRSCRGALYKLIVHSLISEPEAQIIDYKTQQYKLLPGLATGYALKFAFDHVWSLFHDAQKKIAAGDYSMLPEVRL